MSATRLSGAVRNPCPCRQPSSMFLDEQEIREVSVRDLNRRTYEVLRHVGDGERVIVTRHGRAIAALVCVPDAEELLVGGSRRFALLRREARDELEAGLITAERNLALSRSSESGIGALRGRSGPMIRRALWIRAGRLDGSSRWMVARPVGASRSSAQAQGSPPAR